MATAPSLHKAIDEAMKYLESPSSEPLTVESVARAYNLLHQAAAKSASACSLYPRLQQVTSVLDHGNYSLDWISEQADLYRALLLTSFLLLEMQQFSSDATRVLQSSVERCLLLLQVLQHFNNDSLTSSRYALLQAVLEEPLVPLEKQERQYMYVLQRTNKSSSGDESDDAMEDMDDDNVMSGMDQKQLMREEQELLKLASTPIPSVRDGNQAMTLEESTIVVVDEGSDNGIVQEGTLEWIPDKETRLQTQSCHVQVYRCGLVLVTISVCVANNNNESQQQPQACLLTCASTCEPRVEDQSLHIYITNCQHVTSVRPIKIAETTCCLQFQVDSLTEGYAWVTSIQNVIQALQRAAKLQDDLRQEWKDEYEDIRRLQQKGLSLDSSSS